MPFYILSTDKMYIEPNISYSSPRRVIATEGTSIWLHWEYKYLGDTQQYKFKEQIIGFNSTTDPVVVPLAKRNGSNGSLKLVDPMPSSFADRVELSSDKSSVVIKQLRFNDTKFQFFSYVTMEHIYPKYLRPFLSNFSLPPLKEVAVTGKYSSHCSKNSENFILHSHCRLN